VERLDRFDAEEGAWREAGAADTRRATVPEIVSFRYDFVKMLREDREPWIDVYDDAAWGA